MDSYHWKSARCLFTEIFLGEYSSQLVAYLKPVLKHFFMNDRKNKLVSSIENWVELERN